MRAITGKPIKLLGTGEKITALEPFHPERIAGRILDMGDVVSLVERAAETIDRDEAEKMAAKMAKGSFDLDDYVAQLRQVGKMGGIGGVLTMLPGMGQIKEQLASVNMDQGLARQMAIVSSMTKAERRDPKVLNASRRRRIASGAGASVQEINQLLKQFLQMQDMMRKMKKLGKAGLMRHGLKALMPTGNQRR